MQVKSAADRKKNKENANERKRERDIQRRPTKLKV